nr:hypothetical protein [Thermocladium modestius]
MRSYSVTHYRCRACGGAFNRYRDQGTGREFMLRSGKRSSH